jgi:hypothetical protein
VRPFRFHPRSPAARLFALVLLVFGWGMPLAFPHLADDDLLCAVERLGEDEQAHIGASATASADHCAVCHLQRSVRSGDPGARHHAGTLAGVPLRLPAPFEHRHQPALLRLPARAPPV